MRKSAEIAGALLVLLLLAGLAACDRGGQAPAPVAAGRPPASPPLDEKLSLLLEGLAAESARDRRSAAMEIANYHDDLEPLLPAIGEALADSDPLVAIVLGVKLGSLAREGVDSALALLIRSVEDPRLRIGALAGLSHAGELARDTAPGLVGLLESVQSNRDFVLIVKALGSIGEPSSAPALAAALNRSERMLRAEAVWALVSIDSPKPSVQSALRARIEDPAPGVAAGATFACWLQGGDAEVAVEALLRALAEPECQEWRGHLFGALGRMGAKAARAIEPLLAILRDPADPHRAAAAHALAGIGVGSEPVLRGLMDYFEEDLATVHGARDISNRVAAARALGRLGPQAAPAAPLLASYLGDRSLWSFVWKALEDIGLQALPALEALLEEEGLGEEHRQRLRGVIRGLRGE